MSPVFKRIDRHMKNLCDQSEGQTALRKGIINFFVEGNMEFFLITRLRSEKFKHLVSKVSARD